MLLALIFLTGCLVGGVYEEVFCWITEGVLRNRGILYGPWLPIYGIVCLRTVVSFALVGLVFHYRLEPTGPLTVQKLKPKIVRTICLVLLLTFLFLAAVISIAACTNNKKDSHADMNGTVVMTG